MTATPCGPRLPNARRCGPGPRYNATQKLNVEREGFAALNPSYACGSTARLHVGIGQPQWQAALIGDDLLERLAEVELEVVPFRPAEMGRAQHVRHRQQRVVAVDDRLLLVDVDRGIARPPL